MHLKVMIQPRCGKEFPCWIAGGTKDAVVTLVKDDGSALCTMESGDVRHIWFMTTKDMVGSGRMEQKNVSVDTSHVMNGHSVIVRPKPERQFVPPPPSPPRRQLEYAD